METDCLGKPEMSHSCIPPPPGFFHLKLMTTIIMYTKFVVYFGE